ncbi:MAG: 2-oxoacid:acceptor oxidoreductase family protein [Sulfolobales archaeon]
MGDLKELNIIVAGIGGQGQLFLSRVIGEIFMRSKIPVYISETHGLSQRGGSVIVHIRIGSMVRAPLIPVGRGHIMLSLELIEAARGVEYLDPRGVALVNRKLIRPPGQIIKISEEEIIEYIRSRVRKLYLLRASEISTKMKMPISANIFMIGSLVRLLDSVEILGESLCDIIIQDLLPKKSKDVNIKIYEEGKRELGEMLTQDDIIELKKLILRK